MPGPPHQPAILSSWKEIANFFGKGVRTVQRWERTLGLPIYRPEGASHNIVFARTTDLQHWLDRGKVKGPEHDLILDHKRNSERMRHLLTALHLNAQRLQENAASSRETYTRILERRARVRTNATARAPLPPPPQPTRVAS